MYTYSCGLYDEAKRIVAEIEDEGLEDLTYDTTLRDAMAMNEYYYEYSVYTAELLRAVADDLEILSAWQDVHKESGYSYIEPMLINEAIYRCIVENFGNKPLSYFKD